MSTSTPATSALDDPEFRRQVQGLKDVSAAIEGKPSSSVVFSTDQGSVLNATSKATRFLVVDGMDAPHQDGNFSGDGAYAPFVVFDVDAQQNIAGPFDDRSSAEEHRLAILRGEPALLNADALWAYWDTHPMIQPEHAAKNESGAVKVFTGHVLFEGTRIQVDFEVPKDASANDLDAAFLAALAQQAEVNYLEIGESAYSLVEGHGGSAQISEDLLPTSELVTQLTHERNVLMKAIASLAVKTGVARPDAYFSGPDVLTLCDDIAKGFSEAQDKADLYRFLRDTYADQSPDDEAAFAALARTNGTEFDSMVLGAMIDARVKGLDKLANGAGVGFTLSQQAGAAIFAAGGDAQDVDWPAVEEATIQAAMVRNGQSRGDVFNVLCEHSPAAITTERRVALAQRIAEVAAGLAQTQMRPAESLPHP